MKARILGAVDDTHAALAELLNDAVVADDRTDHRDAAIVTLGDG
jgi:hypothetical protein